MHCQDMCVWRHVLAFMAYSIYTISGAPLSLHLMETNMLQLKSLQYHELAKIALALGYVHSLGPMNGRPSKKPYIAFLESYLKVNPMTFSEVISPLVYV